MTQDARITITTASFRFPTIPSFRYIEGDGTGPDIWRASVRVFDAAVEKAYGGKRRVQWKEVLAGEKAFKQVRNWLPDETLDAFRTYLVGIKGPLTTPVGGGIRSLNVALRQVLDLYVCLRPVRWFTGVPSPVKHPGEGRHGDLPREHRGHLRRHRVRRRARRKRRRCSTSSRRSFRRSSRRSGSARSRRVAEWQALLESIGAPKRDVGVQVGVGLKPISYLGTERLVHSAISYADQRTSART